MSTMQKVGDLVVWVENFTDILAIEFDVLMINVPQRERNST